MDKFLNSRVLVVDDEPANIFLMEGILEGEGYRVVSADNGIEAVKIAFDSPPDAIFLDLMMPEVSGFEVLDALSGDPVLRDIPVIVVSAKTDSEDVVLALDKGAVDYIKKPFEVVDLLARLRAALRLKDREDKLKKMIQLKDQFVSIVSHDVRSSLSAIMLYSQVFMEKAELRENLSEKQMKLLSNMFDETGRLTDYLNKLLNLAYIESGKLELERDNVELAQIVGESIKVYFTRAKEKRLKLETDIPDDIIVDVDRTLFIQVINNLISNAIKFTPSGGRITLSAQQEEESIVLKISDSGVGMTREELNSLFSEFKKHYSRGTEGETGTGLGLSICRKIVTAHGFRIDVQSQKGMGTEFSIVIPEELN